MMLPAANEQLNHSLTAYRNAAWRWLIKKPVVPAVLLLFLIATFFPFRSRQIPLGLNSWLSYRGFLYLDDSRTLRQHPIAYLIEQAQAQWSDKVQRQSKTLGAAVKEYRRRYRRAPPKGFDRWFQFAQNNNVTLVDEYDTIFRDIKPFLAIPPDVYRARVAAMTEDPNNMYYGKLVQVHIDGGEWTETGWHPLWGNMTRMLHPFVGDLPNMNWTFWVHDIPVQNTSGEKRAALEALADQGRFMAEPSLTDTYDSIEKYRFDAFCSPGSNQASEVPDRFTKSFIQDHPIAMDVCINPELQSQHSVTLPWHNVLDKAYRSVDFWPVTTFCKLEYHGDMRMAYMQWFSDSETADIAWEAKKALVYWRGASSGMFYRQTTPWRIYPRPRFLSLVHRQTGSTTVMRPELSALRRIMYDKKEYKDLNSWFDVAFSYTSLCNEEDGTCDDIKSSYRFTQFSNPEDGNEHKFLMDIDGNGWSGRFRRLMQSSSAVIKSTIFLEWYSDKIVPWVHYIPAKIDYTDLFDVVAYFRQHDDQAKQIGKAGQDWARSFMRFQDMQAYNYRLLLEMGRLLHRDARGGGMDYEG